jgi:universal stress protein A
MEELRDKVGLPDADIIVRVGRPKDVLLDIQQAINADLIIMAKHSQTGLDKLLGSTTNGVVNKAPCEVLVIPE